MTRLDVSFLGRDSRPIIVRTGAEITHRATWGRAILAAKLVGASVAVALCAYIVLIVAFAL